MTQKSVIDRFRLDGKVALVTGAVLWWLGVQQAVFWGIAAGVLNSIPYFGPLIVTIARPTISSLLPAE